MRIPTNTQGNRKNTLIMRPPKLMGLVPHAPATHHMKSTFHHLMYLVHINIQSLLLEKQNHHRMQQERMDQAPTMRIPTINKQGNRTKHLMLRPPNLMGLMPEASATRHMKFTFHHLINLVQHIDDIQSIMLEEQNHHRMHQERTDQEPTMRIPTNGQGNRTKHLLLRPPNLKGRLGRRNMEIIVGTCTKQRNVRIMFTLRFPAQYQAMSKIQRRTISDAIQYHQALNYIRIRTKFLICITNPPLVRMKVVDHRSIILTTFFLRDSRIQRITSTRVIVTIQPNLATSTDLRGVDGEPPASTCHVHKALLLATRTKVHHCLPEMQNADYGLWRLPALIQSHYIFSYCIFNAIKR
jgi:hypothetical protein